MISVEVVLHSGAYTVSAIVHGEGTSWREWNTYYGYTKREAIKMFKKYVNDKGWRI